MHFPSIAEAKYSTFDKKTSILSYIYQIQFYISWRHRIDHSLQISQFTTLKVCFSLIETSRVVLISANLLLFVAAKFKISFLPPTCES